MSTTSSEPDAVGTTTGKDELDKWNWGAFLLSWIWALGHGLWLQGILGLLVSFIPFGGLVVSIFFALKGNRWAWEKGTYSTKEELREKERKWAAAGVIFIGLIVALAIIVVAAGA
jgi:hypothetical protein